MKEVKNTAYGDWFNRAVRKELTDKQYRILKRLHTRHRRRNGQAEVRNQLQDAA